MHGNLGESMAAACRRHPRAAAVTDGTAALNRSARAQG